jgi:hypothetical protein
MRLAVVALALSFTPLALAQAPMAAVTDHEKPPVAPSKFLNLNFQGRTITLKVEDLLALPQVTVHVHNAHRNIDETYTGPLLSDVLARVGFVANKETEPLILHSSVIATGTDHYFVLYSAAEVEPMFSRSQVIVAVMKAGLPNTEGGNIQLINTDGSRPARWVHGLMDINVMSLSPTAH